MRPLGRIGLAKSYAFERQERALRYLRNEGLEAARRGRMSETLTQMLASIYRVKSCRGQRPISSLMRCLA